MNERARAAAVVVAAFVVGFGVWAAVLGVQQRRAGDTFDFTRWELSRLPNKWVYALGAPFRDDPPADEAIARYFAASDEAEPEVQRLQPAVEAAVEGRVNAVLDELAIGEVVPLRAISVFPPVDIELARTPHVLAVSPRGHIELVGTTPLRPGLSADELLARERGYEEEHADRSALIVPLGGISTYPAIISDRTSYAATVRTTAHEWTHHYLAFFPLGWRALSNAEARTINETVADIVGNEVGARVLERFGDPTVSAAAAPEATPSAAAGPAIDRNEVLRNLRREVDALLAAGDTEAAERRMEAVRQELEAGGFGIRRLNQAFFAWYGTYAARPDSIDPLGPQLRELRERAGSLARFVEIVRGATSREDVATLLDRERGASDRGAMSGSS